MVSNTETRSPRCVADLLTSRRWPFSYGFHNRVKGQTGLYAFWTGNACLYVGKSEDIGTRLYHHRMQEHNPRLNQYFRAFAQDITISYVSKEDCQEFNLLSLEGTLIKELHPLTNVAQPK